MGSLTPLSSSLPSTLPSSSTPITHIVLFRYSPTIPWTTLQTHFESFLSLPQKCLHPSTGKPYILSLKAGKNMSWEPFGKGMTHGFVLEFASQDDLDFYLLEDEVHGAFSVAAKPLVEDSVVVDIHNGVLFGPSPPAPTKSKVFNGSCHCGGITWRARLEKAEHVLCHCDTCKKLGGGPYSLNAIVSRDDLEIMTGSDLLEDYTYSGASGKKVHCYHCGNCTSHVYHRQEVMGDQIIVRTMLLDGGKEMGVGGEIFREGRLRWVDDSKGSLPS